MYYVIKGLVLNVKVQNEGDKVVTVYSYEWGKIQAVVPSAKKIAAKLSSATELLTESELFVFNSHFFLMPTVTGASIIENNTELKVDLNRSLYALYAAEISDKFTPFNLKNTKKYDLIARIWEVLKTCKRPKRALVAFILRFLKLSGYAFSDYLRRNNILVSKGVESAVKKLSNCSGGEVDSIEEIEDEKIWNCVESYLINYISRPSSSIFLKKVEKYNSKFGRIDESCRD